MQLHSDLVRYSKSGEFIKVFKMFAPTLNRKGVFMKQKIKQTPCAESLRQYLMTSSLHGLKYIGATNLSLVERIFFASSFVLVVLLSGYFITNVYNKWEQSPIIITLGSRAMDVTALPFPAVTICNINKARHSVVRKFSKHSTENVLLQNFCYDEYENISLSNDAGEEAKGEWNTFKHFLTNISQPCREMLILCRFALKTIRCMEYFETVLSDEGICCTFNSVFPAYLYKNPQNASGNIEDDSTEIFGIPTDWTLEHGYSENVNRSDVVPRPSAGSGSHLGLHVILNADISDYYCSSTNSAGFKILLHNPTETPRISEYGLLVPPGRQSRIIITPRISTASKIIEKIPIDHRQCLFPNEANLSYFRTYSRKNCEMECISRIIEQICGCVVYYLPRFNKNTKICNRVESNCYNIVRIAMERGEDKDHKCECLAGCYELSFTGDLSSNPLTTTFFQKEEILNNFNNDTLQRDIAVVQIFYAERFFRKQFRDELIGFTEFLSNIGGLLGLFMGFSVVSIIEIFYFLTLRPFFRSPNKIPSKKMSNTISKLVSGKQRWPAHFIRSLDEYHASGSDSGPMFRKSNFNRERKGNYIGWLKKGKTNYTYRSDAIYPYLE